MYTLSVELPSKLKHKIAATPHRDRNMENVNSTHLNALNLPRLILPCTQISLSPFFPLKGFLTSSWPPSWPPNLTCVERSLNWRLTMSDLWVTLPSSSTPPSFRFGRKLSFPNSHCISFQLGFTFLEKMVWFDCIYERKLEASWGCCSFYSLMVLFLAIKMLLKWSIYELNLSTPSIFTHFFLIVSEIFVCRSLRQILHPREKCLQWSCLMWCLH